MYEMFVHQCVERPDYSLLERGYEDYLSNSRPCRQGATNQCAVRMSIALGRAGFGLESFQPRNRVHSGDGRCATGGVPHVLGANELAKFLRQTLASRVVYGSVRGSCAYAFAAIRDQKGILYLNDCFRRDGEAASAGDHIDLFNGRKYYNEIIHPKAGGDETTGGSLFARANEVWFWRLA